MLIRLTPKPYQSRQRQRQGDVLIRMSFPSEADPCRFACKRLVTILGVNRISTEGSTRQGRCSTVRCMHSQGDQDAEDELKLSALHAQVIQHWLQDLRHDPSLDSMARGAINGHVAVCRALKIPDAQIRRDLLLAVNATLPAE